MAKSNELEEPGLDRLPSNTQRTVSVPQVARRPGGQLVAVRRRQPVLLEVPAGRRGGDASRYVSIDQRFVNALQPGAARAFWYDTAQRAYFIEEMGGVAYHGVRLQTRVRLGIAANPSSKAVRRQYANAMTVADARQKIAALLGGVATGEILVGAAARVPALQATGASAGQHYLELLRAGKRKRNKGTPASAAVQRRVERVFGLDGNLGTYCDKDGNASTSKKLKAKSRQRYVPQVAAFLGNRIFTGPQKLTPQDAIAVFEALERCSGAQVAKDVCECFRLAVDAQRLQIDARARPPNAFDALEEGHYYPAKERRQAKPFTAAELKRYVHALNTWEGTVEHRYVAVIQLLCGFRKTRASALRWEWWQTDDVGAHLLITADENRKSGRDFPFPVTPVLATVLEACREFGDAHWVTPGSQNKKAAYRGGPVNSSDWWQHAFDAAKIDRSGRKGSKRVRQTVATWLAAKYNTGMPATALLGHSAAKDSGKSDGAAEVTRDHYLDMYRAGKAHEWLQAWHDHLIEVGLDPVLRR